MTLPMRFLPRPRLTDQLAEAPVALLEAPGGYGKSALATEFCRQVGGASTYVLLESADAKPEALVGRLRSGLRGAGLTDAAARLAPPTDPYEAVDGLLGLLRHRTEPVVLVVDHLRHVDGEAVTVLQQLVTGLPDHHRLLLCGRALAPAASTLRSHPRVTRLATDDLALTKGEVQRLLALWGVALADHQSAALWRATGGWTAAVVLAAAQLAAASDLAQAVVQLCQDQSPLVRLVQAALAQLTPEQRRAVAQLAHLPPMTAETLEAATGVEAVADVAIDAGIPLAILPATLVAVAEPVAAHLRLLHPPEPSVARRAARAQLAEGALLPALRILQAYGLHTDMAETLTAQPPHAVDLVDYADLWQLLEGLPEALIDAHPRVLLHVANACDLAGQRRRCLSALRRAARSVDPAADAALAREIDTACASMLLCQNRPEPAAALAARLLQVTPPAEAATRALLCEVRGRTAALSGTGTALRRAAQLLDQAAGAWRQLGQDARAGQALLLQVALVDYPGGRYHCAVTRVDEALRLVGGRSRQRAAALALRGMVLVDCGRYEEAAVSLRESTHLADTLADPRTLALCSWANAAAASQTGDHRACVTHVVFAERNRDDWYEEPLGVEFLADAAQLLGRVGETALAWERLELAQARAGEAAVAVSLAEGALLARAGDPERAEHLLAGLSADAALPERERWRVELLRAAATQRSGGDPVARATRAFTRAAELGFPTLPLVREPVLARSLLAVAAPVSGAAAGLLEHGLPVAVTAFGRFRVARGGADITPAGGVAARLVKFLAVTGGRAHPEQVIEVLWPDTEHERGRGRLRNVLNRLRATSGDLVVRDGDVLTFPPGTLIDVVEFEQDAQQALADPSRARALAGAAVARYRGDVLPDDLYEQWAEGPRQQCRRRLLALLDLLAEDAERRGTIDEAIRHLDRAIDTEPSEEDRYLQAAALLLGQGRRGRALRMLDRYEATVASLQIAPSPALGDLRQRARR